MSTTARPLTRENVIAAHALISPSIHQTPVLTSTTLSTLASTHLGIPTTLLFKAENLQKIGAFKIRGATHALKQLSSSSLRRGVVTHSSGNHAQALAHAAAIESKTRGFEIPAYIVMPEISTASKIAATRGYGAEVVFSGSTAAEREAVKDEVQRRTGAVFVPPYDHEDVILGQGTAALELQRQAEGMGLELGVCVAPCGGGGLLAGTATALAGTGVKVFGSEPREGADDCARGLKEGRRVESVRSLTIADGLRTPVGVRNWSVISDKSKVGGVFTVSEEEIKSAMRLVVERMKILIEPSSAVPVAVVLGSQEFKEAVVTDGVEKLVIGIVLSGGNTTIDKIMEVFGVKG